MRHSSGKKSEKSPEGIVRRADGKVTGEPETNLLLEKTHLRFRLPALHHSERPDYERTYLTRFYGGPKSIVNLTEGKAGAYSGTASLAARN